MKQTKDNNHSIKEDVRMKITELAKELKMTGEEVLEKAKAMGVPVAKTSDDMSDMDTVAVRNTLTKGSGKAETKVARKTATKKTVAEKKNEPKTTKQANLKMPEKRTTKKAAGLTPAPTKTTPGPDLPRK